MKILRYVLLVLVIIISVFLFIGLFSPRFTMEYSIEVKRPLAHSFSVFMNEKLMKNWLTTLDTVSLISGKNNQVNSKYRMVFNENGKEIIMTETITGYQENSHFNFTLENEDVFFKVDNKFDILDSTTTRITVKQDGYGKNVIMKSLLSLFASTSRERQEETYQKLKELIEKTGELKEN